MLTPTSSGKMMNSVLDNQGFLSCSFDNYQISHAYTFAQEVFKEIESDVALNNTLLISDRYETDRIIQFKKKYAGYQKSIHTDQRIQVCPNGIDWHIKRTDDALDDNFIECRFGISMIIDDKPITYNSQICPVMVNYTQEWLYPWEDQLNIALPIIKAQLSNAPVAIYGLADSSMQFFTYYDDGVKYLRISTTSKQSRQLSVFIRTISNDCNLETFYVDQLPQYRWKVEVWKAFLRKIEHKFKIRILWHQSVVISDYHAKTPIETEVREYARLFKNELDLYLSDMFKNIGIDTIVFCGFLSNNDREILGCSHKSILMFNISSSISDIDKQKTIHHEIFHSIDRTVNIPKEWLETPDDSFSSQQGSEYRAELFSYMVMDPAYIANLRDNIVNQKAGLIRSMIRQTGDDLFWTRVAKREYRGNPILVFSDPHNQSIIRNRIRNRLLLKYRQVGQLAPVLDQKPLQAFVVGLKSQCARLMEKAAKLPVWSKPQKGYSLILVCNPLEYCAEKYVEDTQDAHASMKEWVETYDALLRISSIYLRQEDLLTNNLERIKSFILHVPTVKIGDLEEVQESDIKVYNMEEVPFIRNAFLKYKDRPSMIILEYQSLSCEN